eukprot:3465532-Rhodomonas_salina.3
MSCDSATVTETVSELGSTGQARQPRRLRAPRALGAYSVARGVLPQVDTLHSDKAAYPGRGFNDCRFASSDL